MDELVRHCIRELSFDGDFGCVVSRLRDFITEFYASNATSPPQKLDDAFFNFVWSVIVQQPGVKVGKLPDDAQTDVYVAPNDNTIRGGKSAGGAQAANKVELIAIPDAAIKPLDDLRAEHGDGLRIAVDPDMVSIALIGSHIRSTKLTPAVFTSLQLIARGREAGVSTVDLSKKTGYDAKTVHYLVSKLVELHLVEKRKTSGIASYICIHRYFFDRSPVWQKVVAEEAAAEAIDQLKAELEEDEEVDDDISQAPTDLNFDPIDLRHLSSLPLVRARIVKLLMASPHHMHVAHNILTRIGFPSTSTKTDRRFFATRLNELMTQGVIEQIQVPHAKRKKGHILCLRLISSSGEKESKESGTLQQQEPSTGNEDEEQDIRWLKGHLTLHKQIVDLVAASGTEGTTITEMSRTLCNFDRRIVELLLTRLEKFPPPSHLADLGIAQLQESHGRERRFRYFTMANFHIVAERENLTSSYRDTDLSKAGDYLEAEEDQFYEDKAEHNTYVDKYCATGSIPSNAGKAKTKSSQKATKMQKPAKEKKVKPPKHKNPMLSDGSVKKGRPRKYARGDGLDGEKPLGRGKKRKLEDEPSEQPDGAAALDEAEDAPPPPKKRRGRPPKSASGATTALRSSEPAVSPEDQDAPMEIPSHGDINGGERRSSRKSGRRSRADELPEPSVTAPDATAVTPIAPRAPSPEAAPAVEQHIGGDDTAPHLPVMRAEPSSILNLPAEKVPPISQLEVRRSSRNSGCSAVSIGQTQEAVFPASNTLNQQSAQSAISEAPTVAPGTMVDQVVQDSSSSAPVDRPNDQSSSGMDIPIDPALLNYSEPSTSHPVDNGEPNALEGPQNKRPLPEPEVSTPQPASKRAKTVGIDGERGKGNISQSRREKEFLQVITECGGIVNISSKEFAESLANLVERLMKAGEPVSTRTGSRVDKRTVDTTLTTLESHGKIRLVVSSVSLPTGSSRRIRVAYLPETSQEDLAKFLSDVGRSIQPFAPPAPIKILDQAVEYGGNRRKTTAGPSSIPNLDRDADPAKNAELAEKLFQREEKTIRESLLTEKDTLAQLYGFIPGKAARARILHLLTLKLFESLDERPSIVSRDQRIVHLSYYYHRLPVATYCSLIACLEYNADLLGLLQTPEGPQTALIDLPVSIQRSLQADKSRSQTRILDLLEVLRSLDLVVPLQPSTTDNATFRVPPNNVHPTSFDPVPTKESLSAPQYWHFNTNAPLFLWALKETPARFWKDSPNATSLEGESYWRDLEFACINYAGVLRLTSSLPSDIIRETHIAGNMVKLLRRSRAWVTSYILTWYQMEYLRRFIDKTTKNTPLQDTVDGPTRLAKIAWVISASPQIVRQFYEQERIRMTHEEEKIRHKSKKQEDKKAEKKASLVQKAAEAKQQRENMWEDLVRKVHPEPPKGSAGARVRRVRTRYLQSAGTDQEKWEAEIVQAIEEAKITTTKVIAPLKPVLTSPTSAPAAVPPPPVARAATEKSVETLISQQGPPLVSRVPQKRKKRGEESTKEVRRRHRFQWTREYDELARDASVIIKARCRNGARLDWAALEKVFPAVQRNSVRQRVIALKEQAGGEAYVKRLEDKWYELWMRHRGTDALPDPDPESPSKFDIIAHVKFLRNHIDKNAIRVGFVVDEQVVTANLPGSVADFEVTWNVVEKGTTAPMWDFMWTAPSEEAREKQLLQQAILVDSNDLPVLRSYPSEAVHVADATLKMALGTPSEVYHPEAASALLKSVGEESVNTATSDLLDRGVLSKVVRDPKKSKPGKTYRISDLNQHALGGSVSAELFQDAVAYEDFLSEVDEGEPDWRDWSLFATDGDAAALIELVSENKIDFQIDTSGLQFVHSGKDWNSKRIDDDDIETAIQIRSADVSILSEPSPPIAASTGPAISEVSPTPSGVEHGVSSDGSVASCQKKGAVLVDCEGCLNEAFTALSTTLTEKELAIATLIRTYLHEASSRGLTKDLLLAKFDASDTSLITAMVARLTDASIPIAFWTGYREVVLVSSAYLKSWTAVISQTDENVVRVFPRRWLDISGRLMNNIWDAALKAMTGVIIFRPGVTQAEIRWRLRSVYDRQEINDILQHLLEEGYVKKHVEARDIRWGGGGLPDNNEEKMTMWTMGEKKHWYQV